MKAALRTLILLCCPALLASAASLPLPDNQRTPAQIPPAEIKKLIEDLGNPSFKIRENANKRLADMGKPAFNALKEAEKSTDAEIRERAKLLVNGILVSDRVPTIVKGLEFEIVIEDGGQPHRMVTNTLTKIGVRITNISKSSDLWIHDDVRPKLFDSKGETLHGHMAEHSTTTMLPPRPRALAMNESHTIWCSAHLEAYDDTLRFIFTNRTMKITWGYYLLSKGPYRISLDYEHKKESHGNGIGSWIGSATTPAAQLVFD